MTPSSSKRDFTKRDLNKSIRAKKTGVSNNYNREKGDASTIVSSENGSKNRKQDTDDTTDDINILLVTKQDHRKTTKNTTILSTTSSQNDNRNADNKNAVLYDEEELLNVVNENSELRDILSHLKKIAGNFKE